MLGTLVDIFQVITLSGWPGEWTKRETGQRVTHCSCALLPWLMWLRPLYFELDCQAVCTWKLWHFPLSWFVYERIRLNLINPKVLKAEHGLHVKILDSVLFTVPPWKNDLLRGHFAQYDFKESPPFKKYAMKLCIIQVPSSLALDNWEQKFCQTLGNMPNHSHFFVCCEEDYFPKGKFKSLNSLFHSVYLVFFFSKRLFSFADLFAVRYETKINAVLWHVLRRTFASLGLFTFACIACPLQLWIKTMNEWTNRVSSFNRRPLRTFVQRRDQTVHALTNRNY